MTPEQIQKRVDEIQQLYKEWKKMHIELEASYHKWQKSTELMEQIKSFYFDGEFQMIYDNIENGLKINLATSGEHSVMSQDTLWEAFHDQEVLLWKQLKLSVKALNKENE